MPLSHAILGFLEYKPMSGYDLKKWFDQSITHFWSATQSHIYKALEDLEEEGMVKSQTISQRGKPNRKQYKITTAGRTKLRHWIATPLPIEGAREAWLIQVFFAHNLANQEIENLFEKRMEALHTRMAQCQQAQKSIDENHKRVGIKRLTNLWQLTLDYGINYYKNEIKWLKKNLPLVRKLPPLPRPKKQ